MNLADNTDHQVGVVVIGRNEGVRLKRCIESLLDYLPFIVYVDSGSTDDSSLFCKSVGVHVLELDLSTAFTAGRARNEGMQLLTKLYPRITLVQFVDGDCMIDGDWISLATKAVVGQERVAIVCGRRTEQFPERTVYNRLCDIEWNTPVGESKECGGDFVVRLDAMTEVGGFNPEIIAGEEPDLCFRLRKLGWKIERLPVNMTLHDANINSFSMWWKRVLRSGHAYMQNAHLQYSDLGICAFREVISIFLWGPFLLSMLAASLLFGFWFVILFLLCIYIGQVVKIACWVSKSRDVPPVWSLFYGMMTLIGKVPQFIGGVLYWYRTLLNSGFKIIEYK